MSNISNTERALSNLRDSAIAEFGIDRTTASKLALSIASTVLELGAPEGYELKIDRAELLEVLDRICAQKNS